MEIVFNELEYKIREFDPYVDYNIVKIELYTSKHTISTKQVPPDETPRNIKRTSFPTENKTLKGEFGQQEKPLFPSEDHRKLVRNDKIEYLPYSAILRIQVKFESDKESWFSGTGFLVGPRHLLTTAYNIYDDNNDEWAEIIQVITPLGIGHVLRAYKFESCDIALLVLDDAFGDLFGWLGLTCYFNMDKIEKQIVRVTGYPVDGDKVGKMYTSKGDPEICKGGVISYDISTREGQSGSPVWIKGMIETFVVGIHTLKGDQKKNVNKGFLFTQERLVTIVRWIEESYNIEGLDAN